MNDDDKVIQMILHDMRTWTLLNDELRKIIMSDPHRGTRIHTFGSAPDNLIPTHVNPYLYGFLLGKQDGQVSARDPGKPGLADHFDLVDLNLMDYNHCWYKLGLADHFDLVDLMERDANTKSKSKPSQEQQSRSLLL